MLASVCAVVLATGMVTCEKPVEFEMARKKVEAVVAVFDPQQDARYFYLVPEGAAVTVAGEPHKVDVEKPMPAAAPAKRIAVARAAEDSEDAEPAPDPETQLLNRQSLRYGERAFSRRR